MGKKSNSLGRRCRKWIVYGKKNFLGIFSVALIGYFLLSLWLIVSHYQFAETNLMLLPLYFHLWMFGDALSASALTVVVMMWLALRKRHLLGYFALQSVLLAQAVSSIWMTACKGQILFMVGGIIAGLLFYFMESKRVKARFKVEKMNWVKLYGYMFIVLIAINYFQFYFQSFAYSWPSNANAKIVYQAGSEGVALSPDGKMIMCLDYKDQAPIYLYKTGMKLDDEALIKKIKINKKIPIHEMALNDNNKLLAVAYPIKDKTDGGFMIYDIEKEEWTEGFLLPSKETRKNLNISNESPKDSNRRFIDSIYKLKFNDTGAYLAVMGTLGIEFWDIKNKRLLKQMSETSRDKVYWLEGTKYLRITDKEIYLGDLFEGEEKEAAIEADSFIEVRISPDKKYIAVINNAEEIPSFFIWNIEKREKVLEKSFYDIKKKEISLFPIKEMQKKLLSDKQMEIRRIEDVGFRQDNKMLAIFSNEDKEYLLSLIDIESGEICKEIIRERKCSVKDTTFIGANKIVTIGIGEMRNYGVPLDGSAITYMLDEH